MMRLIGLQNKGAVTCGFALALTCTTCLFGVGAAVAAEQSSPRFDHSQFVSTLNSSLATVDRPAGPVRGGVAPVYSSSTIMTGYRPAGPVGNAFGTVPTNMNGNLLRPISGPMSGYHPTGIVAAPPGFFSGRNIQGGGGSIIVTTPPVYSSAPVYSS